ncbi:hypothetical protein DL93DRAFT_548091 [Clavulina sp. PMI_390]|nr:hypothetical protein DL93DRAFT_548091 [Clavulina sp. PMI_390]
MILRNKLPSPSSAINITLFLFQRSFFSPSMARSTPVPDPRDDLSACVTHPYPRRRISQLLPSTSPTFARLAHSSSYQPTSLSPAFLEGSTTKLKLYCP